MIKILHTADVHIGVENYGKIDANTGLHSRLLDFSKTLDFCVEKAIESSVDVFVLAGDAYKTATPTPTHQKILLNALLKLQKANIAVVISVGNHDHPVSFGRAHALDIYADLPVSGFYVFAKPSIQTILTKNGPLQVVGIPWPTRQNLLTKSDFRYKDYENITAHISKAVTEIIKNLIQKLDPSIPAILTGHLTVNNGVFSGSEKRAVFGNDPLFAAPDLGLEPINYVALGHLHRYQSLNISGQTPVVYSGSLDRIDFGEVRDTKGFVIVEVATIPNGNNSFQRLANIEFIKTPVRPMLAINILLRVDEKETFTTQILEELKKHELTNSIVKVFYHIPAGAADTVDLSLVNKNLSQAWHVAGVIPVHSKISRSKRIVDLTREDLSQEELLKKYLVYKNISESDLTRILERSVLINQMVMQENLANQESGDSCQHQE